MLVSLAPFISADIAESLFIQSANLLFLVEKCKPETEHFEKEDVF